MKIKPYDVFGFAMMVMLLAVLLSGCATVKEYANMRAEMARECQPVPWGGTVYSSNCGVIR